MGWEKKGTKSPRIFSIVLLWFILINAPYSIKAQSKVHSDSVKTWSQQARRLRLQAWDVKDENIDSAVVLAQKGKYYGELSGDTVITIRIYKDLSYYYYWGYSNYVKTREELDSLVSKYGPAMKPTDWANYYSRLGDVVYYDDEMVRSIELYHKALDQKSWDSILVARIYHNLGWTYADLGFTDKAVEYASKGVDILKSSGNNPSANLHGLVYIYKTSGQYDKALEKLEEAKGYNLDEDILSYYYFRKADLLMKMKEYQRAFENAEMGYKDGLEHGKQKYIMFNLEIMFDALHVTNNYPKALKYFKLLEEQARMLENEDYLVKSYNNLASHYVHVNKLDSAIYFLKIAENLQRKFRAVELKKTYQLFAETYKLKGNFKLSNQYLEQRQMVSDSLKSVDSLKASKAVKDQMQMYQLANEVTDKNIQIKEQERQLELKKEKERMQMIVIAFALLLIILIAVFLIVIYKRLVLTRRQKEIIEEQKEELNQINEEILAQRDEIERQKYVVETKNEQIKESISAAQRIQNAFFTYEKEFTPNQEDYFVTFRPLDIVSGDFYWFFKQDNVYYAAVVDCTGHGVPGALLSMLGASFLNEIVSQNIGIKPAVALDRLRDKIVSELNQSDQVQDEQVKEGMDLSICKINQNTYEMEWAGANNPLYLLSAETNEIEVLKGDKEPIGITHNPNPFTNHKKQLQKGDRVYLFSDGFADQFGGPKKKKIGYRKFRELLVESGNLSIEDQGAFLYDFYEKWIREGKEEAIDDVCIVGIKV